MAFCFSGSLLYELTSVLFLCFSCLIPLLYKVANKFFFLLSFIANKADTKNLSSIAQKNVIIVIELPPQNKAQITKLQILSVPEIVI